MKSLAAAALLTVALAVPMAGTAQAATPRQAACYSFFGYTFCSSGTTGQNNNIGKNCPATAVNSTVTGCKTP